MGAKCDACAIGFFHLQASNPDGCTPCDCNGRADDCRSLSASAPSTEICACYEGYRGRSCQVCDNGFFQSSAAGAQITCEPCACNGHSRSCDRASGVCSSCQDQTTGDFCEQCEMGYFGNATQGTATDCQLCGCDVLGSSSDVCDAATGQCSCRPGVDPGTRDCSACLPGFFNLTSAGCIGCTCDVQGSLNNTCDPEQGVCVCINERVTGARCDRCVMGSDPSTFPVCTPCGECFDEWIGQLTDSETQLEQRHADAQLLLALDSGQTPSQLSTLVSALALRAEQAVVAAAASGAALDLPALADLVAAVQANATQIGQTLHDAADVMTSTADPDMTELSALLDALAANASDHLAAANAWLAQACHPVTSAAPRTTSLAFANRAGTEEPGRAAVAAFAFEPGAQENALELSFRTNQADAMLVLVPGANPSAPDYLALALDGGNVVFAVRHGPSATTAAAITLEQDLPNLNDGAFHRIRAHRRGLELSLEVDGVGYTAVGAASPTLPDVRAAALDYAGLAILGADVSALVHEGVYGQSFLPLQSSSFTWSGSTPPPLTGCLDTVVMDGLPLALTGLSGSGSTDSILQTAVGVGLCGGDYAPGACPNTSTLPGQAAADAQRFRGIVEEANAFVNSMNNSAALATLRSEFDSLLILTLQAEQAVQQIEAVASGAELQQLSDQHLANLSRMFQELGQLRASMFVLQVSLPAAQAESAQAATEAANVLAALTTLQDNWEALEVEATTLLASGLQAAADAAAAVAVLVRREARLAALDAQLGALLDELGVAEERLLAAKSGLAQTLGAAEQALATQLSVLPEAVVAASAAVNSMLDASLADSGVDPQILTREAKSTALLQLAQQQLSRAGQTLAQVQDLAATSEAEVAHAAALAAALQASTADVQGLDARLAALAAPLLALNATVSGGLQPSATATLDDVQGLEAAVRAAAARLAAAEELVMQTVANATAEAEQGVDAGEEAVAQVETCRTAVRPNVTDFLARVTVLAAQPSQALVSLAATLERLVDTREQAALARAEAMRLNTTVAIKAEELQQLQLACAAVEADFAAQQTRLASVRSSCLPLSGPAP